MKAIVPAAGQGTRLYPQTHTKPKPMVRVAGKPILGHILDGVVDSPTDEVVIVVGVMRDHVTDFVRDHYSADLDVDFVEQTTTEGLGHSVYQARDLVGDEGVCIALGDMLFENGYDEFLAAHRDFGAVDGSLGVKPVDEPSSYGVVDADGGRVVGLEEKPDDPSSNLAISGIYFVEDADGLFAALDHLVTNDIRGAGGEYQLTDALRRMVEQGADFRTFEVGEWYDCGRPETLLRANRVLLDGATVDVDATYETGVVIPPVDLGADVDIERSVVGPHVSVADGAHIVDSRMKDSIVGEHVTLEDVNLERTIVGSNARVTGTPTQLNVGDSSEVEL